MGLYLEWFKAGLLTLRVSQSNKKPNAFFFLSLLFLSVLLFVVFVLRPDFGLILDRMRLQTAA